MATYCAIIVPRAQLLAEAVTQGVFMASLYQLFCLLVAYCGGEAELIRRVKPNSLNLRVGPCCCWPCCCLPQVTVNKHKVRLLYGYQQHRLVGLLLNHKLLKDKDIALTRKKFSLLSENIPMVTDAKHYAIYGNETCDISVQEQVSITVMGNLEIEAMFLGFHRTENTKSETLEHVRKLRMLILQLPVVQGLVYMILMVMWAEEESLYQVNYMYLQPVVVLSILFGIWGISMTIKMLAEVLKDHHMQGKFLVLQFVLLLAKMQGLVFRILVWASLLPCRPPITPTVYANLIYNSLMLAEMVILGIVARLLYRKELPDLDFIESRTQPQQVYAVGDVCIPSPEKILASQEHKSAMEQDNNNVA
uniref:Organic solute transporter alpha-like protein n=1 Tax=Timema monikensis TaxID=170555 RepID=A0A7R9E8X4_9NEOP|nr:unnamed protein product [Timema monikensis]